MYNLENVPLIVGRNCGRIRLQNNHSHIRGIHCTYLKKSVCFKDPYTKLTLLFLQFVLPVLMEFNRLFQGSLHQADTAVSAVRSPCVDGVQQTVSRIHTPSWHFCFCSSFSLCWWSSTDCFKDPYTKLTLLFLQFLLPVLMEFNRLFQGSLHQADTSVSAVRSPCVDGVQQTVSRIPTPSWHFGFCSSFSLCWWSSTDCFKDPYTKLTLLFL